MESHRYTLKYQSGTILLFHCIPVATEHLGWISCQLRLQKAHTEKPHIPPREASLREYYSSWIIKVIQLWPHASHKIDAFKNQPEVDCHLEMMNSCSSAHKSGIVRKRLIWFSQWTLRSSCSADCLFCCTTWVPACMISRTLAVKMQGRELSISCRCNLCSELNETLLQKPRF